MAEVSTGLIRPSSQLIPKKEGTSNLKDHMHFSLVHSVAKKNCLKLWRIAGKVDSLIAANQSAFIRGRPGQLYSGKPISENILLLPRTGPLFFELKTPYSKFY
jgi:hypothetical protein